MHSMGSVVMALATTLSASSARFSQAEDSLYHTCVFSVGGSRDIARVPLESTSTHVEESSNERHGVARA